jgi:hypothetical protein
MALIALSNESIGMSGATIARVSPVSPTPIGGRCQQSMAQMGRHAQAVSEIPKS